MPKRTHRNYQPKLAPATSSQTVSVATGSTSWKDHPLAIAAIAVSGTIVLGVLLVKEVVLPVYTVSLQNKLSELSNVKSLLVETEEKAAKLQARLERTEKDLFAVQQINLFGLGNPYPATLDKVRLGDSVDAVLSAYPDAKVQKSDGYWSIELPKSIFRYVAYFFDEKSETRNITHISFKFGYKVPDSFLQEKLIATLGVPFVYSQKGFFSWEVNGVAEVYKPADDEFMIMREGYRPGYWPRS